MGTNLSDYLQHYSSNERVSKEIYPYRVYNLLRKQGFDPDRLKYIHIAGSKGKGTLAWTAFEILKHHSCRTGLFTSPHIFDIRERFVTHQGMISHSELHDLMERFFGVFESESLHFFELCLFLALVYFIEQEIEFVVLEVGVGGRFDPTNFCNPILSLLGNISMEHRAFLGSTISEIAYDKAGIIKPNSINFSLEQSPEIKEIFLTQGSVRFFDDLVLIKNSRFLSDAVKEFDMIVYLDQEISIENLILNRIGEAHVKNFCLATAGVLSFMPNLSPESIRHAAAKQIPYRMHLISSNILIDTAHNGASFENLMYTLDQQLKWDHVVFYLTILEGKELHDISTVLKKYQHIISEINVFDFDTHASRKSQGKELYRILREDFSVSYIPDLAEYRVQWEQSRKIVFAGSFYSIPIIEKYLQGQN